MNSMQTHTYIHVRSLEGDLYSRHKHSVFTTAGRQKLQYS